MSLKIKETQEFTHESTQEVSEHKKNRNAFKITHTDGNARVGILQTKSGSIETPFFMPVVTKATGKHITTDDYNNLGDLHARAVISNSLLLSLRPGTDILQKAGGIHKFMNFKGIVFTDCGGFQSSSTFFEMKTKKGIHFRSPYDNKKVIITPKTIMKIQLEINSDIAMMLDDMTKYGATKDEAKIALINTHRWGEESLKYHNEMKNEYQKQYNSHSPQLLFGIVQGNFYPTLREESAKFINSLDFDGIAIGGVAIGEPLKDMYIAVDSALPHIDKQKIKYVMGLGSPVELLEMINRGIDCFDSIYPTQNARHSSIFTMNGKIYLDKARYSNDFTPIEKDCGCHTCKTYTRAYVNHLIKINEPVAHRLRSIHNQYFLQRLMENVKLAIKEKRFQEFKKEFLNNWEKHKD
ncbi:MAG: tRNA guanosine(34) transglycosylase Tgt [Candidatus Woesearchaeota archaeon]|jgi:queuine tRNA-ribosyltransferase